MIIIPAIDLKDGKVVRLLKGDFNTARQVAEDPVETARAFREAGARYLHIVDLDGSRDGVRKNTELVRAVVQVGLKTELGGGIRSMKDLEEVFALGIWRAVIGSAAVSDPEFVKAAVERYGPERVAVGVDAKDGLVRTAGWVKEEGVHYLDFAKRMEALGVKNLIFTDIDTDGMQTGPSFARLQFLRDKVSCSVTTAGGVSSNADLQALNRMGVEAVIVGKSWYVGALDLERAIREAGPQ